MLKLKDYQENHINEIKQKIEEFLKIDANKICTFEAPTGSGKTIMMAELIQRLVYDRSDGREISFIWVSVHNLHEQSRRKLKKYYDDLKILNCSIFPDLQNKEIQDKEILFLNWESINKKKNIYILDNEKKFNLSTVLKNTKESNRDIILIIDESHDTANTDKSKEIIEKMNPKITIEVSATPKKHNMSSYKTSIDLQEVKKEEVVKKSIKLNSKLSDIKGMTTDELILKTALDKRNILKRHYQNECKKNNIVNPLVLIQLPDNRKGFLDKKSQVIDLLNSKFGINVGNGKLAIFLSESEEKKNLKDVEKNDNAVEVLIFKQAITVGWDCPRSSILVLFREWGSFEFSIQTVGRIIRMPEMKYYNTEDLNHAYIYTNIEEVQIAKGVAKDYITVNESIRNDVQYNKINIPSIYRRRKHEKTRLNAEFRRMFLDIAHNEFLVKKISLNPPKFKSNIIKDVETAQIDVPQILRGDVIVRNSEKSDLQFAFDDFTSKMASPYAHIHSQGVLKRVIHKFFESETEITDLMEMATITLYPNNKKYFIDIIEKAKTKYEREIVKKVKREFENIQKWNVPKIIEYTKNYELKKYKKSIMQPFYIKVYFQNEVNFMDFIDKDNNVKWWFKNEVNDIKYFAVKYTESGKSEPQSFYVDFIIYMTDGRIGLFDTKAGFTAKMAKAKAEALSKYIKNNRDKKLFGGITIFAKGEWLYNDNEEYEYNESDLSDWKPVDFCST